MNEASRWRLELGRRIGLSYAANPKAQVVMVAGSTGRGAADRYSDLEIDVYWREPPSDEERRTAAEGAGGAALQVFPYEDDEWAEEIDVGGFHVGTSTFLVATMERYLSVVLDDYSTDPLAQMRLYSVLHAHTLVGEELVARWRARAMAYPPELSHAMLRENLVFDDFGYAEEMLAARDDVLLLADVYCRVERQILGALLGLNRLYLPNPSFKGMDEIIGAMRVTPPHLSTRLKTVFRLPPLDGVRHLHIVCEDTLDLVDRHVPAFDTAPYRAKLRGRRGAWDEPPT